MARRKRPNGLTVQESFRWFMPGEPPLEGCWDWLGPMGQLYGEMTVDYLTHRAHRVSYEMHVGPIPDGLLLRHTCDRPVCVQPTHLIPGTIAENGSDVKERRTGQHRGVNHEKAKLTDADVCWVRAQVGVSQASMARSLGVDPSVISRIISGKSWSHVD